MKEKRYVDPIRELAGLLLSVDKPERYTGGETGRLAKKEKYFQTLIAFPDLYEIGMGNHALRILYNGLNKRPDISCDRAFAPAPDFEKLLGGKKIPLYGLDTGISLSCVDLLMFTLGYELGLNGILTMLKASGIPLHCAERNKVLQQYPIIIAGGPAVSNPLPCSPFIDAFWIGEAEAGFFELAQELSDLKKSTCSEALQDSSKGRAALFEKMASHPNVWVKGKEKAKRAFYSGFSEDLSEAVYPVPSMKIVQNHGTVEIMRGCSNGCRFCHAGFWYRPQRQKSRGHIARQVKDAVEKGGWQEISLSSLSSGDYTGSSSEACSLEELTEKLNQQFADFHISFQLPSLKVTGFSLSVLEKISATRKSGLTFAVETPLEAWQLSINKKVSRDSAAAILEEAKKRGWKGAKFYFMIGLPAALADADNFCEEEEIVSFIADIGRRTRLHFNINVGIFIPKPHTPYQWEAQIDSESAERKLIYIRSRLKTLGHKVGVSDSLISRIEGLLSRGDERSGLLCEEAWRNGSRLEPWSEYINKDQWMSIIERNSDYVESVLSGNKRKQQIGHQALPVDYSPWTCIDSCVTEKYLRDEMDKSIKPRRTPSCNEKCSHCGVCNFLNREQPVQKTESSYKTIRSDIGGASVNGENIQVNGGAGSQSEAALRERREVSGKKTACCAASSNQIKKSDPSIYRVLFSFSKENSAVFHGHLSLIEIFSMSIRRAKLPVIYTQGFNPLVKMEFASPLSIGISADCEIAVVNFFESISIDFFIDSLNKSLPEGINIKKAEIFHIKSGMKKHSVSSLLWGFAYENENRLDYISAKDEKIYRQSRLVSFKEQLPAENCAADGGQRNECGAASCMTLFDLKRREVLAKNITNDNTGCGDASEWMSYFDAYKFLYN